MDPYYQTQGQSVGQAPPVASSRDLGASQQMQVPSAPSMQLGGAGGQQQQQHNQLSSGGGGHHHHGHQRQAQQVAPGAYLDAAGQQDQRQPSMVGGGHHSSSRGSSQVMNSGGHHHGGAAPPAPTHSAGGHHSSSSRYAGGTHSSSHRQANLHQHRSSAAAISDPMMASTITDHLASASGPMTGSGSALNQLGYGANQQQLGGNYYGRGGATDIGYHQQPQLDQFGAHLYQPQPAMTAQQQHQSRYDAHYGASPRHQRHHSTGHNLQHHAPAGAYQLDGRHAAPLDQLDSRAGYYPAGGASQLHGVGSHHHQSLGNLPAATRYERAAALASGYDQNGPLVDGRYDGFGPTAQGGPIRPGSMPPDSGLGSYNPLDDQMRIGANPLAYADHQPGAGPYAPQVGFGPNAHIGNAGGRDAYVTELKARLQELQNSYVVAKRELETATQKLGSSMHSIKSFWSPELKKERALRKEEQTKYALINDQMKLMRIEVQKQALLIGQLEDELRLAHETRTLRTTDPDIQQHIDAICREKESLFQENCMLRSTIRELEMRIETQKQTLAARDDSIKKMVEMMNNKGIASKIMEDERLEMDRIKTRNIELEARLRHYETIIESKDKDQIKSCRSKETAPHSACANAHTEPSPPKSPTPKQRKSHSAPKTEQATSKVERLKNRITLKCPLPSKERLNELILKSNTSHSLSSTPNNSSSGISSSRSSELLSNAATTTKAVKNDDQQTSATTKNLCPKKEERNSASHQKQQQFSSQASAASLTNSARQQGNQLNGYELCHCYDCQASYSRQCSQLQAPNQIGNQSGRKMVSFRPSVEHIGSPSYRLLNDFHFSSTASAAINCSSNQVTYGNAGANWPHSSDVPAESTCDSLHVTKDFSLVTLPDGVYSVPPNNASKRQEFDDYLRPLDCSTPKAYTLQATIPNQIQAEVHATDYTCLCSPDFNCVHNYPPRQGARADQRPIAAARRRSELVYQQQQQPRVSVGGAPIASEEFRDQLPQPAEFDRQNCVDCKNLSTYVNLSSTSQQPAASLASADTRCSTTTLNLNQDASSAGGYESGEYKQLIRSKQCDVYGNLERVLSNNADANQSLICAEMRLQNASRQAQRVQATQFDGQMNYLSPAARRLQQTLDECDICTEHLARNGGLLECSCLPHQLNLSRSNQSQLGRNATPSNSSRLLNGAMDLSNTAASMSSKSYHTASSSLPLSAANNPFADRQQQVSGLVAAANLENSLPVDASNLSVLPLASSSGLQSTAQYKLPPQINQTQSVNNNNIDSSLSSLFVYRHVSDNDNEPCATSNQLHDKFDPDSLELSNTTGAPIRQRTNLPARGKAGNTNWLRTRPRSDYISLSSATSSISANQSGRHESRQTSAAKTTSNKIVGADLTQSSLAKRRQLANQQQQISGKAAGSTKKSLVANKNCSSSSPNVNAAGKQAPGGGHSRSQAGASNGNSKKSIYQCVKSHLLDTISGGSSSLSAGRALKLKRSKSSVDLTDCKTAATAKVASSASLPRELTSNRKQSRSKSAQMEELRSELARREQEMLTMGAKMKALEDQQRDSQRHIRVLKDSLVAKEDHYNLLLADVEELRRNLDERNKLIERRSYQQTFGVGPSGNRQAGKQVGLQELQEMQSMIETRDKRIGEMQRKILQLDNLLADRDAQLERARLRLEHSDGVGLSYGSSGGGGHHHTDVALLNHLEETLSDKEKQIALLREQRDRTEHELNEERDSHERTIKEYKMKLNSAKLEMDKQLQRSNLADTFVAASDRFGTSGGGSGLESASLVKRLELEKRSLMFENDRLRDKLELQVGSRNTTQLGRNQTGAFGGTERASSAIGLIGEYSVVEFERLQEALESQKQDLRRAQAECRMNEAERKRAQDEVDKLSERYERSQSELHKLKAKLENATSERDQLFEECERQQQLISKSQTERDCALADINQVKLENDRLQQAHNKLQLDSERLQAQLERAQLEYRKLDDRYAELSDELRQLQLEKSNLQRELNKMDVNLKTNELQQQRLQQEKDLARNETEKVREKYDRLEGEFERFKHDKDSQVQQQITLYKERSQQQLAKWTKEREQMNLEVDELRDRLLKQQKLIDASEHESRGEVRIWKEKYERLLAQFEKLNEDIVLKQKESQMVMDKLQRAQSDILKLESKLEQSEMDRERMVIEVEKFQQVSNKAREEHKKWQEELGQLQEMYTKTNTKLLKLSEVEEKLRIDYEKCQMDLEVLRERYEKLQLECRKLQQERDRLQVENERVCFEIEALRGDKHVKASQVGQLTSAASSSSAAAKGSQTSDEMARLSNELERSLAKLEQYQREINKLQLEKERLILDSKAAIQQTEQQYQQQLLKMKSSEEKLVMELERNRLQLGKVQSKCEQTNVDQEKLVSDKERLQQQLLLLQQEVDKFRSQQNNSTQETKRFHEEEMQRVLQELETIREKYTQQRKELLQFREMQQNHDIDKDILKRELEAAEARLEKMNQAENKQRQDTERCLIEIEKMKDKAERKQQELARAQKERDQFAQEITNLHRQIQQLQNQFEQQLQQHQQQLQQQQQQQQPQQQPSQQPSQQQPATPKGTDEVNKLKQMLVKSESELQKIMTENQRLQMEHERLKLQLDDAAQYISKIENENKAIGKQNSELLEQLKQQVAASTSGQQQQPQKQTAEALERAQQEMKKMQDVIKKSAQEIQRLVDERAKAQDASKELQRLLEQTKGEFNSTVEQYEFELDRCQKEIQRQQQLTQAPSDSSNNEYKIKFEKAVDAIKAFQKTSDDMKKEIIKLNERNKSLSEQNQSLAQALKSADDSLKQSGGGSGDQETVAMRQQVAKLSELCAKLENEARKSGEDCKQQLAANQQLRQAMDKSKADYSNLKAERDKLQAQLEKLIDELEHREDEMANLQAQQDKSSQKVQADENELRAYEKQLEEREKALESKRQELSNMASKLQKQQQQEPSGGASQQLEEMIAKLQQQVKSLEEERNKLRGELERVRNELKQSQLELERLLKILSNSEEEKFNASRQIEQLQAKIRSMSQTTGGAGQTPQQQQRGPPPPQQGQQVRPPGQQQPQTAQQQQGQPRQPPPQQQGRTPQQPQQQRPTGPQQKPQQQQQPKPPSQGQRPSGGASGFISGFFQ